MDGQRKRLGLALGGGGARGMAHVGVLRVLEREGIPIDCIAGTSAGALAGAVYAAGLRGDRLVEMALQLRWSAISQVAWPRDGFVSFARMESYLVDTVGDLSFADLEIPYAAVAADLATGKAVILNQGRLAPAVRASTSVPGIITPIDVDGLRLVDGGIANNLPISVVRDLGADVVIAVGLGSPPGEAPRGALRIGVAAIEYMILKAGDDPGSADVYIPIPVWGLASMMRLSEKHRLIDLGQQAAEAALPAIWAALGQGMPGQKQEGGRI
jgi:NTE family protein